MKGLRGVAGVIRVGVLGATGRMGREVCRAVAAADDLELVAAVDPEHAGADADGVPIAARRPTRSVTPAPRSRRLHPPSAVLANVRWCLEHGDPRGRGHDRASPADLRSSGGSPTAATANCIVAPNFALGAVLLLRFAVEAAGTSTPPR